MNMTVTVLTLTYRAWAEVRAKMIAAGLQKQFHDAEGVIDMSGIELRAERGTLPTREGAD